MNEDEIHVPTGLTTSGLLPRRYLARFADALLLSLLLIFPSERFVAPQIGDTRAGTLSILAMYIVGWVGYGALLESSGWQATLGKRLMGLRVYGAQGERPSFLQAAGRNLIKEGPFLVFGFVQGGRLLALVWLCAHLLVMYRSPGYQAIHDHVVHTLVAAPEETTQLRLS